MRTKPKTHITHPPPPTSPEELESRKREARILEQELHRILESRAQAERSIIEIFAKSVGAPQEHKTDRIIWHGVVQFANANLGEPYGLLEAFLAFRSFTALSIKRFGQFEWADLEVFSFLDLESARYRVKSAAKAKSSTFKDACCQKLSAWHEGFCTMLTWLADPNGCPTQIREKSLRFLLDHGGEGAIKFDIRPSDAFDETGDQGVPFLFWKDIDSFRSILSPVANFIFDRLEQYHTAPSTFAFNEAVPVVICKRSACHKFVFLERGTKDFCSSSCRTLYRQEMKPEEHAKYQRKYRERFARARRDRSPTRKRERTPSASDVDRRRVN